MCIRDSAITVLGYDTNDCADVVSAIASLNSIITNAVIDPKSIKSVVRTTPNAYPLVYTNKSLVFDDDIAIDPASRNYTASCADVASSISILSQFRHCGIFNLTAYCKSK